MALVTMAELFEGWLEEHFAAPGHTLPLLLDGHITYYQNHELDLQLLASFYHSNLNERKLVIIIFTTQEELSQN